jgi:hypothetical protein
MFQLVVINVFCNNVDEGIFQTKSALTVIFNHTYLTGKVMPNISFDQSNTY